MKMKFFAVTAFSILLSFALGCQENEQPTATPEPCDRTCLEGFVDQYLDAVTADDPSLVPFTEDARFTEDGVKLELGEGLWASMAGKGTYKFYVPDVETQQVAFMGTVREESSDSEEGVPSAIALRLKIENRKISEVEQIMVRDERAAKNIEKMGSPHPVYLEAIPPEERALREDLIKTANMYFSGLQLNDGKGEYPFTDDCDRYENGTRATNVPVKEGEKRPDPLTSSTYSSTWSCKEQFESGLIHFVTRIRDRRFVAVDRERGIVFSFVFFDHAAGKTRTFETPDGRTVTAGPTQPWTWEIAELFKIENGLIRRIEAILQRCPYGMDSGWSTWEDGRSDKIQDIR